MYCILYSKITKEVIFACKDVVLGKNSIKGDTGMIAGWSADFDYICVAEEPPEYLEYKAMLVERGGG